MRTYRLAPTLIAVAIFLVIANVLLIFVMPEAPENTADDEAQLLYFAVVFEASPPSHIDQNELQRLLAKLDPDARDLADHFSVISYTSTDRSSFELQVRHHGNGNVYNITINGVGYGE